MPPNFNAQTQLTRSDVDEILESFLERVNLFYPMES